MSWLIPSIPGWSRATPASTSTSIKPVPAGDGSTDVASPNGDDAEHGIDLDIPPPFPLPNSAQRSSGPPPPIPNRQPAMPPPSFAFAPPSPPRPVSSDPPSDLNIAIIPDAVPLGNMAPPPSTTKKPNFGIQVGGADGGQAQTLGAKSKGKRGKVALGPGFSALDWNRLASSGRNLRGTEEFPLRVTMAELAKHNKKNDAWSVFNGKVYNITPYLPYHPGGADEMMRTAGRDGTKLFMLTHSWVNLDYMLQECMVGVLVRG